MKSAEMSNGTDAVRTPCSATTRSSSAGKRVLPRRIQTAAIAGVPGLRWKRERRSRAAVAQRALHAAHGGLVDLAEVGWARELLGEHLDARLGSRLAATSGRADELLVVVREQEGLVERARSSACAIGPAPTDSLSVGARRSVLPIQATRTLRTGGRYKNAYGTTRESCCHLEA